MLVIDIFGFIKEKTNSFVPVIGGGEVSGVLSVLMVLLLFKIGVGRTLSV